MLGSKLKEKYPLLSIFSVLLIFTVCVIGMMQSCKLCMYQISYECPENYTSNCVTNTYLEVYCRCDSLDRTEYQKCGTIHGKIVCKDIEDEDQ